MCHFIERYMGDSHVFCSFSTSLASAAVGVELRHACCIDIIYTIENRNRNQLRKTKFMYQYHVQSCVVL